MKNILQINLGTQLKLKMTPELQRAIQLLQYSTPELIGAVQDAVDSNPLLEKTEEENTDNKQSEQSLTSSSLGSLSNKLKTLNNNSEDFSIDSYPNPPQTLKDHLIWQCRLSHFSERNEMIATVIIDAINDTGYLACSLEEIIDSLPQDLDILDEEVLAILHKIQNFEPIGVAARNLQECLTIQLNCLPEDTEYLAIGKAIVDRYLGILGRRKYNKIRQQLLLNATELSGAIRLIKTLEPKPGYAFSSSSSEYIIPEIVVKKINNTWQAFLNPDCLPKVRLTSYYQHWLQQSKTNKDATFLKNQLSEAKWFLKSLENRNRTLLKVAQAIVSEQQGFFEEGPEAMVPMILHDIADNLNLHESTISRITTRKYLTSLRGVFELKYFFSSYINTNDGKECSSTAIRALIKKIIAKEDSSKPMSDQQITEKLNKQGIQVARRTVAKYRENLAILPSSQRKNLLC